MALGVGMHATTEAARHPEQVLLVEGLVGARQLAPPVAEPPALLPQREVSVEHDPIRAVVPPLQELLVVVREIIVGFHAADDTSRLPLPTRAARRQASHFFQAKSWKKRSYFPVRK